MMEADISTYRVDQGEIDVGSLWNSKFVLVNGFKRMLRLGTMTGIRLLRDVFFVNDQNHVLINRRFLAIHRWKDDHSNQTYSQGIKYYGGSDIGDKLHQFIMRFKTEIINDLEHPSAVIDTIQLGRFFTMQGQINFSRILAEVSEWKDEMYSCVVYHDERRQECPICLGLASNITQLEHDYMVTQYDIGTDLTGCAIRHPRKAALKSQKLKQCVWYRPMTRDGLDVRAAHIDPIRLNIPSLFEIVPGYEHFANVYHHNMQHGHLHWHIYNTSIMITMTSNGVVMNALDMSIWDVVINTYKHIILDALIIGPKGYMLNDKLYWTCIDVLHELFLPIASVFEKTTNVGKQGLAVLMAIIHNGVLLRDVISLDLFDAPILGTTKPQLSKTKLWTKLYEVSFELLELDYGRWLLVNAMNGVVPISNDMLTIDRTFLAKNYEIPDWVGVTKSFININVAAQGAMFIAKAKYKVLCEYSLEILLTPVFNGFIDSVINFSHAYYRESSPGRLEHDTIYIVNFADRSKMFYKFISVGLSTNNDGAPIFGVHGAYYYQLLKLPFH